MQQILQQIGVENRKSVIFDKLKGEKSLTSKEVQELFPEVSRFSIIRDLNELIEEGKVIREGDTKGASYRLNDGHKESLRALVHRPPHEKKIVQFNNDFLANYQPNKTFLLPEKVRLELGSLGKLPIEHTTKKRWIERFLIDLSWASSRMEGSTLSWLDTEALIKYGETAASQKDAIGVRHVLNHKEAISYILKNSLKITKRDMADIHTLVSKDLLERREYEGALRNNMITISGSSYQPSNNPWQIKESFEMFCSKAESIHDPIEKTFFVMAMLPYIQPFHDANKRTSRIALNIPLLRAGLCPFSFLHTDKSAYHEGLAAVYEHNRTELLADCFVSGYLKGVGIYKDLSATKQLDQEEESEGFKL